MRDASAGTTILVIDDDATVRDTLEGLLGVQGYALLFAEDGPSGLSAAAARRPDVILVDMLLPGMNGLDICRALRSDGINAATPVIMMSAADDSASRTDAMKAGADDFLSKPFNRAELWARTGTAARLARLQKQAAQNTKPAAPAMADSFGRCVGEMMSLLKHDLSHPLTGVRGAAEHLLVCMERNWELPREEVLEKLNTIVSEADRMLAMIERIRQQVQPPGDALRGGMPVNQVVGEVARLAARQSWRRNARIGLQPCEADPQITSNTFVLTHILLTVLLAVLESLPHAATSSSSSPESFVGIETALQPGAGGRDFVAISIVPDTVMPLPDSSLLAGLTGEAESIGGTLRLDLNDRQRRFVLELPVVTNGQED